MKLPRNLPPAKLDLNNSTHLLRITLLRVKPEVSRELLVPSNLTLELLHEVVQIAMGWEDEHLHEFIVGSLRDGEHYGPSQSEADFGFGGPPKRQESRYTLQQIAPSKGDKFLYWYDFGDDWQHEIAVKDVGVSIPGVEPPRCLDGVGACPPEDCGGPPGYANLLAALADPKHEDHEDMLEWVADDFDPARFDIDAVNEVLGMLAGRSSKPSRRRSPRTSS